MLFCSKPFAIFFAVVFLAYWATRWQRGRVLILLAASIYFYAGWNRGLAALLCVSSVVDYLLARAMDAASPRVRKALVLSSVVGNLGLLCYFKYANFFLHSLQEAADAYGLGLSLPALQIILPVGISFYTFEAINYTVDVYRRKIPAERDLTHFMLFILFFPHLISGPIVRARAFLPLIARRKRWSWLRANTGVLLFLLGMIKKLAIANRLAGYVDPVFADPESFATATLWLATVAYAVQIYCDFSGYSDMAMGLAHLFGYHLAVNFNLPFLAPNLAEFWRRWHISLSSWIRDYVFIPLGGSAGPHWKTYRNLLITFTLCGLWHGAGWNFAAFGFVMGLLLVVHSAFRTWCEGQPRVTSILQSSAGAWARVALTFCTFCLTLVIFRCPQISESCTMLSRMLSPVDGNGLPLAGLGLFLTLGVVAVAHALGQNQRGWWLWEGLPGPVRGLGFGLGAAAALILAPGVSQAFIYFQF